MRLREVGRAPERERELAGSARAGGWVRAKARTSQRAYVRRHWWRLSLTFVGIMVAVVGPLPLQHGDFFRGALLGAGVATALGLIAWVVVQQTGTASIMMGDQAEQWTAEELRKTRVQGWRLVNHMLLGVHDVDHVLVGPGGAIAVETKWSISPWSERFARDRLGRAVEQAAAGARDLRLWSEFNQAVGGRVYPLVVLWGGGTGRDGAVPARQVIDGVTVVTGPSLSDWRGGLHGDALSPNQVEHAWDLLDQHLAARRGIDNDLPVIPVGAAQLSNRVVAVAVGAVLAAWAAAVLMTVPVDLVWRVAAESVLLAGAYLLVRSRRARWCGLGAVVGAGGTLLLGVLAAVGLFG